MKIMFSLLLIIFFISKNTKSEVNNNFSNSINEEEEENNIINETNKYGQDIYYINTTKQFDLNIKINETKKNILIILFYSINCGHCNICIKMGIFLDMKEKEMKKKLYPLLMESKILNVKKYYLYLN